MNQIEDTSLLIKEINGYCRGDERIRNHIERIEQIWSLLAGNISPELHQQISNLIRHKIQKEATKTIEKANDCGAILVATGVGKTKIVIDRIDSIIRTSASLPKILIVVPTETLRDRGWVDEFKLWGKEELLPLVKIVCYASLPTMVDETWDYIYLDEGHNISEGSNRFFFENGNIIGKVLFLTATRPTEVDKIQMLKRLNVHPIYELTLAESVKLGIVAPYDVTVIKVPLDAVNAYITAGGKAKQFKTTEVANYKYLTTVIANAGAESLARIRRQHFLTNVASKTEAARLLLTHIIPKQQRTLIFCGSKEQANRLSPYHYYSKPVKPRDPRKATKKNPKPLPTIKALEKYHRELETYERMIHQYQGDVWLELFCDEKINQMACVDALNEGVNISNLDNAIKLKTEKKERTLIQQTGRIVRFRPNHIGRVIILCSENTVEEDWVKNATMQFDQAHVHWVTLEDIRTKKYIINFN